MKFLKGGFGQERTGDKARALICFHCKIQERERDETEVQSLIVVYIGVAIILFYFLFYLINDSLKILS